MDATGNSDSWLAQKRNVVSVFEKFRSQLTPELRATLNLSQPFDKTDSDSLQNRKIYENFALEFAVFFLLRRRRLIFAGAHAVSHVFCTYQSVYDIMRSLRRTEEGIYAGAAHHHQYHGDPFASSDVR